MNNKCKLVIFSDLHYAPEAPIKNGSIIKRKLVQYSIPILNKLIDKINNEIRPDLVVNLGDLIEDFRDMDKDIKNLKFTWRILKNINTKFYCLAGNHDLRSMKCRQDVEKIMGYKHSTFSFNINGYHYIFLGLDVKKDIGEDAGGILRTQFVSKEDIEWLKKDLASNKLPCIIFNHFGIAEDSMEGNWWFKNNPEHALLANRKEIKEIFKKYKNIIYVFSGHQHWTKSLKENGINYQILGSLTEDINDNGIPDGIYLEIDLEGENILIKERHIKI